MSSAPSPVLHGCQSCPSPLSSSPSLSSMSQRNCGQPGGKYLKFCLQTYLSPFLPPLWGSERGGFPLLVQSESLLISTLHTPLGPSFHHILWIAVACTWYPSRHRGNSSEQNRQNFCLQGVCILGEAEDNNKISEISSMLDGSRSYGSR